MTFPSSSSFAPPRVPPITENEPSNTTDSDHGEDVIECTLLGPCNAADHVLQSLVQMVNDVYDTAEQGMWNVKGFRTNLTELQHVAAAGELFVAIKRQTEATCMDNPSSRVTPCIVVGCVRVRKLPQNTSNSDQGEDDDDACRCGSFGMLVVDPHHRGRGIGRALVRAAEQWAVQQGLQYMQLELLKPRTWIHPTKEFNQAWYIRLGYVYQSTETFAKDFPALRDLLATECDYTIWRKQLF